MQCPESFVRFDKHARQMLRQTADGQNDRTRLVPSFFRLTVDELELSDQFAAFAGGLPQEWSEAEYFDGIADVLRRTGYYHAISAGDDTVDWWLVISDRLLRRGRQHTILYLLDRCRFPKQSFDIAGYSVIKMDRTALGGVGQLVEK